VRRVKIDFTQALLVFVFIRNCQNLNERNNPTPSLLAINTISIVKPVTFNFLFFLFKTETEMAGPVITEIMFALSKCHQKVSS